MFEIKCFIHFINRASGCVGLFTTNCKCIYQILHPVISLLIRLFIRISSRG